MWLGNAILRLRVKYVAEVRFPPEDWLNRIHCIIFNNEASQQRHTILPDTRTCHCSEARESLHALREVWLLGFMYFEMKPDVYEAYQTVVLKATKERVFFTKNEGYIGLTPAAIEPQDPICVPLGCVSPMIL